MSTEESFLAAVRAAPNDDLPRLVFADWLDDNDQQDWAQFIRWQVNGPRPTERPVFLRLRSGELSIGSGGLRSGATKLWDCLVHPAWQDPRVHCSGPARSVVVCNRSRTCGVVFRRGFIAAVWGSYVSFPPEVVRLLKRHPVEIFHCYGDIPGRAQVERDELQTDGSLGRRTSVRFLIRYTWRKFKTTRQYFYDGHTHFFGNPPIRVPDYASARLEAVMSAFCEGLRSELPTVRSLMTSRPASDDPLVYNYHCYPAAGCPDLSQSPENPFRERVRRLDLPGPVGGVPDQT